MRPEERGQTRTMFREKPVLEKRVWHINLARQGGRVYGEAHGSSQRTVPSVPPLLVWRTHCGLVRGCLQWAFDHQFRRQPLVRIPGMPEQ